MRTPRGGFGRATAATALFLTLIAGPGQEAAAQEDDDEPEMAEAPLQFRLSGTAGIFLWGEKEDVVEIDNLATFGIDVESLVVPAVAFRLGGAYGSTTASDDTASVGVHQWQIEVFAVGRVATGPFRRSGIVPFGLIGAGAVILDPKVTDDEDLRTRNQGAFSLGGGIDIGPASRFGGRVEFRHYRVSLEDVLEPLERKGETLGANLIMASVYWKF